MRKDVILFSRSLVVVAAAAALAGCFETTGLSSTGGLTAGLDNTAARSQAMPAGRATRAPSVSEPATPPEYLTLDKAKGECWDQAETDKKAPKALDARGKWVEKCAAAKMRAQATQWASPNAQSASAAAPAPTPSLNNLLPAFATTPTSPTPPAAAVDATNDVMQKGM